MEMKLTTIDPNQGNLPDAALIHKVISDNDRLPNGEHEKAVQAFFRSDSIASGIGKDFAFVEKIPQLISDFIDNKSWECFYVCRGVVTPYYCRYVKGSDSDNFQSFISAKRPNGLETTVETVDRLLEAEPEVQWKFRTIIYESRQGERNDLATSGSDCPKLDLSERQQKNLRAANRAAEAIPEVRELLDRSLISIDIAAKLGRDIRDSENLSAEEREYVDRRDLIGLRIKQYIYTNTIPEDEDKEPAYSRKLNEFIKDLLGIKDRSKPVRMDNPKKAAEKLLQFYSGDRLKELVNLLSQGLDVGSNPSNIFSLEEKSSLDRESRLSDANTQVPEPSFSTTITSTPVGGTLAVRLDSDTVSSTVSSYSVGEETFGVGEAMPAALVASPKESLRDNTIPETPNLLVIKPAEDTTVVDGTSLEETVELLGACSEEKSNSKEVVSAEKEENPHHTSAKSTGVVSPTKSTSLRNAHLNAEALAKRLNRKPRSMLNVFYENPDEFSKWSQERDPDGIAWQRSPKKGRSVLFTPVPNSLQ